MIKKNEYTCRWRVDFKDLAYEGGGSSSWSQYYWTKLGARWSRWWHLHISSYGGKGVLIDLEKLWTPSELSALETVLDHARTRKAGWQKPVAPPPPGSRPTGLPPKEAK